MIQACRRSLRVLACLAAFYTAGASITAADGAATKVFVGAPMRDGFVDTSKDVEDSLKDLRKRLNGAKGLSLVTNRDDADIAITVVARGVGSEPYGQRLKFQEYYNGAELTSVPMSINTWWVTAILEVHTATYRKEFIGSYTHPPNLAYYGGAWTACSAALANNIKTWVEANRERLKASKEVR